MSRRRVVVTGLGVTSPVGGDVATTWEALVAGKSGVRRLTQDWAQELPVQIAASVAVEPTDVLERVKARRLDRSAQFAMVAAMEAWADSGLAEADLDRERLGVAMASGIGGGGPLVAHHHIPPPKGPPRGPPPPATPP